MGVVDPDEVHAVYRVPISELRRPRPPDPGRAPLGLGRPRLPHRRRQRRCCGASPPASSPGSSTSSAGRRWRSTRPRCVRCRPTCCKVNPRGHGDEAQHHPKAVDGALGEPPRLAAPRAGPHLRALRLLAGIHHRRVRDHRPAARWPDRGLARADGARRRRPVGAGLPRRPVHRDPVRLAGPGRPPVRRGPDPRPDHLAAGACRRRGRRCGAGLGRRAPRRVGARRRHLRAPASPASPAMVRSSDGARQGRPGAAGRGRLGAQRVQRRGRVGLLPAVPRPVRPGADRPGPARTASGCSPTPTSRTPRHLCSRSAAPTTAGAASRAPASSTPTAG